MVALIQSENHAVNKEKTAGRYQFDTHPTGIGLIWMQWATSNLIMFLFNWRLILVSRLNLDIVVFFVKNIVCITDSFVIYWVVIGQLSEIMNCHWLIMTTGHVHMCWTCAWYDIFISMSRPKSNSHLNIHPWTYSSILKFFLSFKRCLTLYKPIKTTKTKNYIFG